MSKENGTVELVENVDYFEMKDGTWYTIQAISKKYGIADNTVSWKGNEHNIAKKKIAGTTCYKDDVKFTKGKPGGTGRPFTKGQDNRRMGNESHMQLVSRIRKVEERVEDIYSMVKDIYDHLTRYKTVEEVLGRPGIMDKWNKDNEQLTTTINGES